MAHDGRPIGIFDSGIGGLTVTSNIVQALPAERLIYFGDNIHIPYGQRTLDEVRELSLTITAALIGKDCKSIVVACNTASAAALEALRKAFPKTPFVGMEPAVKPAVERSITRTVGVIATPATFQSAVYASVVERFAQDVEVLHQPAPGLVELIEAGEFRDEISPYEIMSHQPDLDGNTIRLIRRVADVDEGPRPDTSLEGLAKLRTVFRNGQFGGSVTAGNSSQMSDGAGAILLASEQAIKDYGLTPLARFVSFSVAGVRPEVMGIGPIAAIPKALKQAGLTKDQLDWIELNEAFAAQALAVIRDSELDPDKVNPLGGAIALGHPLGATGAVRTATILHGMRRRKQKYGMVTMCIGTGMGAAGIFEAL